MKTETKTKNYTKTEVNTEAPQQNKEALQQNKEAPQQNKEAPQRNKEALQYIFHRYSGIFLT